jgi:hypothetical protein
LELLKHLEQQVLHPPHLHTSFLRYCIEECSFKSQNLFLNVRTLKSGNMKHGDFLLQKNLSFELGDGKDDDVK